MTLWYSEAGEGFCLDMEMTNYSQTHAPYIDKINKTNH